MSNSCIIGGVKLNIKEGICMILFLLNIKVVKINFWCWKLACVFFLAVAVFGMRVVGVIDVLLFIFTLRRDCV